MQLQLASSEQMLKGLGYWTFDTSLLKHCEYVNSISNILDLEMSRYKDMENKGFAWDMITMEVRGYT